MTDKKYLKVTDASCTETSGDRQHDIIVQGALHTITFKHGIETHLPFEQGVKFATLDGFKVEDSDGIPLGVGVTADGIKHELAADEVVAKLTELTVDSLKLRAAAKKGGEIYLKATDADRADLIAFILGKPPAELHTVEAPEAPAASDDDLGDFEDAPASSAPDADLLPQDAPQEPEDHLEVDAEEAVEAPEAQVETDE